MELFPSERETNSKENEKEILFFSFMDTKIATNFEAVTF